MKRTREALSLHKVDTSTEEEVFKIICADLAEDIHVDLVSIWFFNESQTAIQCQIYFDSVNQTFENGQTIYRKDCPHYFEAIIEDSCIVAPDALHQHATRELAADHLIPNGIQSTLDFILHKGRTPVGVICCEARGEPRNWTEKDKSQIRIIAELVSHRFRFNLADSA